MAIESFSKLKDLGYFKIENEDNLNTFYAQRYGHNEQISSNLKDQILKKVRFVKIIDAALVYDNWKEILVDAHNYYAGSKNPQTLEQNWLQIQESARIVMSIWLDDHGLTEREALKEPAKYDWIHKLHEVIAFCDSRISEVLRG
jgi:hypothetical protein